MGTDRNQIQNTSDLRRLFPRLRLEAGGWNAPVLACRSDLTLTVSDIGLWPPLEALKAVVQKVEATLP